MGDAHLNTERKVELLKEEYLKLQEFYEDIDNRSLTIKGFSVTVSAALLGAGLVFPYHFWLLAAFSAAVFWYVDALWRTFQYPFSKRMQVIENGFRGNTWDDLVPMQIYATWKEVRESEGLQVRMTITERETMFPHIIIIVVSLSIYIALLISSLAA